MFLLEQATLGTDNFIRGVGQLGKYQTKFHKAFAEGENCA